jgi:hypothetical protein
MPGRTIISPALRAEFLSGGWIGSPGRLATTHLHEGVRHLTVSRSSLLFVFTWIGGADHVRCGARYREGRKRHLDHPQ